MRHQEFLAGVGTRAGIVHTDDARTAATATLAALAARLDDADRRALADALPTLLEQEAGVDAPDAAGRSVVDDVAHRAGWTPERSRYAVSAVVGQLTAEDAELGRRVATVVPADLTGTGPTLPPDAASEGAQGRPQPLAPDEVERALHRLVDWSGDVSGIERTIGLPPERLDLVLQRVREAEHALSHRTHVVDRTPTSLTLRARTESLGVVTALDVELAGRVDDAVVQVGSGG